MKPNRTTALPELAPPAWAPVLCGLLQERWKLHRNELQRCRRKFSAESVHESRVAARRLRAALELLGTAAGVDDLGKARRALKQHLKLFAPLRDAQVQRSLLPLLRLPCGVREAFEDFLRRREEKAGRRAQSGLAEINTRSIAKTVAKLDRALRKRAEAIGEAALHEIIEDSFRRVCARRDLLEAQVPATIHLARVAFKRFRYRIELLVPLLPGRHRVRVPAMRRYQSLMGTVQDACVTIEWFEEFAAGSAMDVAVLARVRQRLLQRRDRLVSRYLTRADALRDFWPI
jgi:CHAD domain-containing protein